ncbi:alpha-hydroxy acid oxidase [Rhizobium gallicum]|uniref:alpha-hydroxy acid oxidase n=1 Tax=Rhizobium gallicum TaxID=56730 RepID=UPI00093AD67E|nr:alpha-hydroxy acid oxidase [Rhizobium gallicum]
MKHFLNYREARQLAKRRLPRSIFEYIDRGTEDETGLRHNRNALDAVRIRSRALAGGTVRNQNASLFGKTYNSPIIVAPTAFAGLVWYRGEVQLAKAAAANGIPFCAATEAIDAVQEIAGASDGETWFQLYMWEDENLWRDLLERAWNCGVRVLVSTVDTVVSANREYNVRNGFGMPFRFGVRNVADAAFHPRWVLGVIARYLAAGRTPSFANYPGAYRSSIFAATKHLGLQPDLNWEHMRKLRNVWKGSLILKGILRTDDAIRAVNLGADGIVVSNHGGRQLDIAVAPIEVLAEIVDTVGAQTTVIADSGVQRGSDILKLLAVGAKAVMVGRGPLYGTAIGGMPGASQMIGVLRRELDIAMALTGCEDIRELNRSLLEMP